MPRTPACNRCCIRLLDCSSCARCVPRYICVDVTVTPGPYTDLTCCDPDYYGLGHFSFRMTHGDPGCSQWSGSGTCTGLETPLDLVVSLTGTYPDCTTVVSSDLMEESATFEGVLPVGMTGTAVTPEGDILDWEISSASVVENPLIRERCSPCTCATCLPERLCVQVTAAGDAYHDPIEDAFSFLWDCETKAWLPEGELPAGFSLTIELKDIAEALCGINVDASGDYGSYSGEILLESDLDPCRVGGAICEDSDGLLSTLAAPALRDEECEEPDPHQFTSYIDVTIQLRDDPEGPVLATVIIRDQSCGECVYPDCPAENICCEFEGDVPDLVISGDVGSVNLVWDDIDTWGGGGNLCTVDVSVQLRCRSAEELPPDGGYELQISGGGFNYLIYPTEVLCDPIELHFTIDEAEISCDLTVTL